MGSGQIQVQLGPVFIYGGSVQQALEIIKGADRVVTQHLVELLGNGVPLGADQTQVAAERQEEAGSQPSKDPDGGLDPRTLGPRPESKADA